jgi:hypothetical protein
MLQVTRIMETVAARFVIVMLVVLGSCIALAMPALAQKGKSHKRKTPLCRAGGLHGRHSRLIAANSEAEVYEKLPGILYGCAYGGRPHEIGPVPGAYGDSPDVSAEVRGLVLAGAMAAYEKHSSTREPSSRTEVTVLDLRTGQRVHNAPSGTLVPSNPYEVGSGRVTALVVKSDGSVAWIAEDYAGTFPTGSRFYQVHELGASGESILASDAGIVPESLALAGNTLYWTEEGKPMSATLE